MTFWKGATEMNKRIAIGLLASTAFLLPALETPASARSVSATTGKARFIEDTACFRFSYLTGAVTSTCAADFIVPLTVDTSGSKAITFRSRADGGGLKACRAVANDRFGTALSASAWVPVPWSSNYVTETTGTVSVPAMGVFLADCIASDGTELMEFDYTK
jgi:hypothetical protein